MYAVGGACAHSERSSNASTIYFVTEVMFVGIPRRFAGKSSLKFMKVFHSPEEDAKGAETANENPCLDERASDLSPLTLVSCINDDTERKKTVRSKASYKKMQKK